MSACAAGYPDHVDLDVAIAFAEHALGAAERAEVERRIDACTGCRGIVAEAARDVTQATRRERPPSTRAPRAPGGLPRPGDLVGRYVIERPLGAGGMGVVSLARDPELRRAVVIKIVRPDAADPDMEARLRREAQAMAQLSHPNVVQIFDLGRHGDRLFLAMELVVGQTLDAWLIERERAPAEIIAMCLQAGAGLEAAHRAGLLHRDFKPTNVLVDRDGVAKVTDFGLARAIATGPTHPERRTGVHAVLTLQDSVVGTPAYMSPEQAAGQPVDPRTDQYALALTLLDALVGQQPHRRTVKPTQPPAELDAALARAPARARGAIIRALRLDPAERYPDLASFLRDLAPPRRHRWWPLVAAGALVAAGGAVASIAGQPAPPCTADAPRAWRGQRDAARAELAALPRAFAAWHAEHVIGRIDAAVADLGLLEVDRCEGKPVEAACLEQRRAALAGVAADPATALATVADCRGTRDDSAARADALEASARGALARGDFDAAASDFVASAAVGERAGDDSLRARAALGLLEVARMRGDHAAVRDTARQLDGMLARHGDAAADVLPIAIHAAHAYIEVGDVTEAFRAVERASRAARSPEETLRARVARARAQHVLRWDAAAADRELASALAERTSSEAAALAIDLALDRGLVPRLPAPDPIRQARVLGRADPSAGHAQLAALPAADETTRARVALAHADVDLAAGRAADAHRRLHELLRHIYEPTATRRDYVRVGLSAYERTLAWLQRCAAAIELGLSRDCWRPTWLAAMHPRSPLRARYLVHESRQYQRSSGRPMKLLLIEAIAILKAAGAHPVAIAELQLDVLRSDGPLGDLESVAEARAAFAAAGRDAEVAELDAMIGAAPAGRWPDAGDRGDRDR